MKETLDERRERSRRLSRSINSLRTAFRYAIETGDADMTDEITVYAAGKLGLSELEISYVNITAQDEENYGEDI